MLRDHAAKAGVAGRAAVRPDCNSCWQGVAQDLGNAFPHKPLARSAVMLGPGRQAAGAVTIQPQHSHRTAPLMQTAQPPPHHSRLHVLHANVHQALDGQQAPRVLQLAAWHTQSGQAGWAGVGSVSAVAEAAAAVAAHVPRSLVAAMAGKHWTAMTSCPQAPPTWPLRPLLGSAGRQRRRAAARKSCLPMPRQ